MRVTFACLGRENLGVEYLSAVTKAAGHDVRLAYDPGLFSAEDNVFHIPPLERRFTRINWLVNELVAHPPDVLAFSVYTSTFQWSLEVARRVREHARPAIVFGGWHPTLAPHAVMGHPEVDYAVIGEAEQTFPELLAAIAGERKPASVRGIYYRENGTVLSTGMRPLIDDLDTLPWPDKELFAAEVNLADDYVALTSRGCPCSCTYCGESVMRRLYGGRYFRRRKVEPILAELAGMRERYHYREVMFNDPIFFTHKEWLFELLAGYRARVGVPFRCFGQVKYLDEAVAGALRDAGCYAIEFGLQTANETLRRDVLGRPETNAEVRRAFAICDHFGLRYDVDHIFGLPGEQADDFPAAAHLYADARRLNRVKVHLLAYFPGTPIIAAAKQMGLADEEDERRAAEGETGDFFRESSVRRDEALAFIKQWKNFYKLQPLLGGRLAHAFARRGWNRWFGRLPGPLVILLQVLLALKHRDYRYWLYVKYYRFRLRRHREVRRAIGGSPFPIPTRSTCPDCGAEVPALLVEQAGDVHLRRTCPQHGESEVFFWRDAKLYARLYRDRTPGVLPAGRLDLARGDAAGFVTTYALDVTLRCNMRCPTCVSAAGGSVPPDPPQAELLARVPDHRGDRFPPNLALVGGESTLREDLPEIIRAIRAKGVEPRLNSNGLRLTDEAYLRALREAGLRWVILQFDGFRPEPSIAFRGQDYSRLKLEVIDKLGAAGLLVHLAVMVDRGVNDGEVGEILRFAARTPQIRRVSFYPRSHIGRIEDRGRESTQLADLYFAIENGTHGEVTRADLLAAGTLGRRLFRLTGHPMFRRRVCITPFVLVRQGERLIPAGRLLRPTGPLREPGAFFRFVRAVFGSRRVDEGGWGLDVLLVNIEKFYEGQALDLVGARMCHHIYLTGQGAYPFCVYNTLLRPGGCA